MFKRILAALFGRRDTIRVMTHKDCFDAYFRNNGTPPMVRNVDGRNTLVTSVR